MKIEEKIMKLRKEKGLSQEEFGEEVGVSRQAVSMWENGETKPDIDKVKLICEKYNISYEYLLDDSREDVEEFKTEKEEKEVKEEPLSKKKKALKKLLKIILIILIIYLIIVFYKIIMYIKIIIVANSFDEENFEVFQVLKSITVENQISEVTTSMFKYNDMMVMKANWSYYYPNEEKSYNDYPQSIIYINDSTNEKYELQWQEDHYDCKKIDGITVYNPSQIVKEYVPENFLYILRLAIDPTRIVLPNGTMYSFSPTNMNTVTLNGVGLIDSYVGRDIYGNLFINRYSYNYNDWMYKNNYKNPMEEYKDLIVYEN